LAGMSTLRANGEFGTEVPVVERKESGAGSVKKAEVRREQGVESLTRCAESDTAEEKHW